MQIQVATTNSRGVAYALAKTDDGYGVYKLCVNYVRGHNVSTWRYVEKGLSLLAAEALYKRRTK